MGSILAEGGDIGTETSVGNISISRPIKQLLPYIGNSTKTSMIINTLVDNSRQGTIFSIVAVVLYQCLYNTHTFHTVCSSCNRRYDYYSLLSSWLIHDVWCLFIEQICDNFCDLLVSLWSSTNKDGTNVIHSPPCPLCMARSKCAVQMHTI